MPYFHHGNICNVFMSQLSVSYLFVSIDDDVVDKAIDDFVEKIVREKYLPIDIDAEKIGREVALEATKERRRIFKLLITFGIVAVIIFIVVKIFILHRKCVIQEEVKNKIR